MKRLFVKDEVGEAVVLFVDKAGKAVYITESAFNEPLTLEVAKKADYSNFDGCEDAEVVSANYFDGNRLIDFNEEDWAVIVEF